MTVNISCPVCNNRGELPDDTPSDAVLTCRACGVRFPLWSAVTAASSPAAVAVDSAVWVGDAPTAPPNPVVPAAPEQAAERLKWRQEEVAIENTARAEWIQQERAIARDRALLEARSRELDSQEAKISTALQLQAEELQAELDRQVAAERENLARRAEELDQAERSVERRSRELDDIERDVQREWQAEIERLRVEVAELRERVAGQEEMIERMMAAGQRLIRQRDKLRAKVRLADESLSPLKSGPDRITTHDRLDTAEVTRPRR